MTRPVGPEGAIAQLGDRDNVLVVGEPNARRDRGAAGARPELEVDDVRLRIFLVEDVDCS